MYRYRYRYRYIASASGLLSLSGFLSACVDSMHGADARCVLSV